MVDRVPGALQPAARTINVRNLAGAARAAIGAQAPIFEARDLGGVDPLHAAALRDQAEQAELVVEPVIGHLGARPIGRASCRERVCQNVLIWVVAVSLKKKTTSL